MASSSSLKYMKRTYFILIAIAVISAIVAGVWFWQKQEIVSTPLSSMEQGRDSESSMASETPKKRLQIKTCNSRESSDSASDRSSWQNKEAEFYSIQFPPGWCWIELEDNPQVHALTYRSDFDLTQHFLDIGVPGGWPLTMKDNEEVVVTFNGAPTLQGTDRTGKQVESIKESFDSRATRWMMEDPGMQCAVKELSAAHSVQVCSYDDQKKKARLYFVANKENTIFMTAFTGVNGVFDERILDAIADSMTLK